MIQTYDKELSGKRIEYFGNPDRGDFEVPNIERGV